MPAWAAFCGGTYQALSPVIAADQAVNVYVETREVPGSEKQVTLYGTPGRTLRLTAATLGCRGLYDLDGRRWGVYGDTLYEIDLTTNTATSVGTVQNDGRDVFFTSNGRAGRQLGLTSGGFLYVLDLDTNVFQVVPLPFSGAETLAFLDGYGLINERDSPTFWFSALEDLTVWDALDFVTRSNTADNIVALAVSRDRVWVLGSQTTTLYYDSGDQDTPFLPYPGATIQVGLVNAQAFMLFKDVLYWIAQSAMGVATVVRATDPAPEAVSTPPIARFLDACPTLDDVEMLVYGQEEHVFIAITAPSSTEDVKTYVFDERESMWHARAGWNSVTGRYTRWNVRGCCESDGLVLVGDAVSGGLYTLDLDVYTDAGAMIPRERTAPYLASEAQWLFLDQFELGIQAGVGLSTGQGSAPEVLLEVSRDGARTWVSAGAAGLGPMGAYTDRAIWRKLGRSRADRLVLRVRQTDPVKCVWGPGAWLRISQGTGQL